MKRVYLSGPMTGIEDFNFPAFHDAAGRLRWEGFEVINPADLNADGTEWHQCMRTDLKALLDCDVIALLDGWEKSAGAHLEMHVAHRVGIEIITVESLLRQRDAA